MDTKKLRDLSPRQRALVAISVLFDGIEAGNYLESDAADGKRLKEAADSLASEKAELRIPLAGTLLRVAISELG